MGSPPEALRLSAMVVVAAGPSWPIVVLKELYGQQLQARIV